MGSMCDRIVCKSKLEGTELFRITYFRAGLHKGSSIIFEYRFHQTFLNTDNDQYFSKRKIAGKSFLYSIVKCFMIHYA